MKGKKHAAAPRPPRAGEGRFVVERIQTGVRMEKRLLKVLRALADYHDLTLGDLLEGIVLHAFDGKCPFGEDALRRIADLKRIYKLDLDSRASHRLIEEGTDA
jgi:hypothetical protein